MLPPVHMIASPVDIEASMAEQLYPRAERSHEFEEYLSTVGAEE